MKDSTVIISYKYIFLKGHVILADIGVLLSLIGIILENKTITSIGLIETVIVYAVYYLLWLKSHANKYQEDKVTKVE